MRIVVFGFHEMFRSQIKSEVQQLTDKDVIFSSKYVVCDVAISFLHQRKDIGDIIARLYEHNIPNYIIPLETVVVNVKKVPHHIFIGKQSKWYNPYTAKQYGREKSNELYREHLEKDPLLLWSLWELDNKILGCHCKPKLCHGDVVLEKLDDMKNGRKFLVKEEQEHEFNVTYTICGDQDSIKKEVEELREMYGLDCFNLTITREETRYKCSLVIVHRKKLWSSIIATNIFE